MVPLKIHYIFSLLHKTPFLVMRENAVFKEKHPFPTLRYEIVILFIDTILWADGPFSGWTCPNQKILPKKTNIIQNDKALITNYGYTGQLCITPSIFIDTRNAYIPNKTRTSHGTSKKKAHNFSIVERCFSSNYTSA